MQAFGRKERMKMSKKPPHLKASSVQTNGSANITPAAYHVDSHMKQPEVENKVLSKLNATFML